MRRTGALAVWMTCAVAACGGGTTSSDLGVDTGSGPHDGSIADTGAHPDGSCSTDADGDGHISITCGGDDCDDADPHAYPSNPEICDAAGHDDDCNPDTFGPDRDHDGFVGDTCCNRQPGGALACGTDCDDTSMDVSPSAPEVCDGIDDNCNGTIDEGVQTTFYRDLDGDHYGDGSMTRTGCSAPTGYVLINGDCDDTMASVLPTGTEVCNGIDDNCNGMIDEGVMRTFYVDADGDGYGALSSTMIGCTPPTGYVAMMGDCNDGDAAIHPGAADICDTIDNNCDGTADVGCACVNGSMRACGAVDGTGAFYTMGICHTGTQTCIAGGWNMCSGNVDPGTETCNGLDDDCDGVVDDGVRTTCYADTDGDGYSVVGAMTTMACSCTGATTSRAPVGTEIDCNASDPSIHPRATELCDGIDQNCDGVVDDGLPTMTLYTDVDMDGHYGTPVTRCSGSPGTSTTSTDCNDNNDRVFAGESAFYSTPYCTTGGFPCYQSGGWGCFRAMMISGLCSLPTGPPSWDYNCSGGGDAIPARAVMCSGSSCSVFPLCFGNAGYDYAGSPPGCGSQIATGGISWACGCGTGMSCITNRPADYFPCH